MRIAEHKKRERVTNYQKISENLSGKFNGIYFHIILVGKCTAHNVRMISSPKYYAAIRLALSIYTAVFRSMICKRSNIVCINRNTIQGIQCICWILSYRESQSTDSFTLKNHFRNTVKECYNKENQSCIKSIGVQNLQNRRRYCDRLLSG